MIKSISYDDGIEAKIICLSDFDSLIKQFSDFNPSDCKIYSHLEELKKFKDPSINSSNDV